MQSPLKVCAQSKKIVGCDGFGINLSELVQIGLYLSQRVKFIQTWLNFAKIVKNCLPSKQYLQIQLRIQSPLYAPKAKRQWDVMDSASPENRKIRNVWFTSHCYLKKFKIKNKHSITLPSSLSIYSLAPKTKMIFQFL